MRRPICLLATLVALPVTAAAQGAAPGEPILLDEIVLTAGITPVAQDGYARAHTVLTATEIEDRGIATVQDALRALPGVSVSGSGASIAQVRIRGAEANHTLILIDGIEAAGGEDEYVLTGLETTDIDRIEVLRGPQSVFYGSNASAGVINIITRDAPQGLSYGGSVEAGNGGAASVHVSRRGERGGLRLSLSARDDLGYDQSGDGGGKDGINRKTAVLSSDVLATDDLRLGVALRQSTEDYGFDAENFAATDAESYLVDADLFGRRDEFQGGVWAEYTALDGRLVQRLDYQHSITRQSQDNSPFRRGQTEKLKYRASLGLDGSAADASQLLNLLAEHQRDSNSTAPGQSREMSSVALEYRAMLASGLDVQAGLRHDANRVFADFTSWNLGLSWQMPDRPFRLHASAGTGLVNPSYFELYADAGFFGTVYQGNPDLRPEKNSGFDLGVEAQLPDGRGTIDVTYFNETLEDEITDYLVGIEDGVAFYSYRNQSGESPRHGVEVAARILATDSLTLGASYTYLDAENPDGSVKTRRPRHEAGLSATLSVLDGRGSVTGDLRHVAGTFDTQFWGGFETRELPSYTVVNLAAGYDLTPNVRATARVVNLFDRDYSDVWGFANQGRTSTIGLQARW
ncbi:vitamin B12 transporter [Stutzerimonas stutzeri]|nr:vitamin B12 transporter [Stutzerimonas stutzeri]